MRIDRRRIRPERRGESGSTCLAMADQLALHAFAQWVAGCSGNEKQEVQTFVQKLLTAWGWADATEAGGVSFEHNDLSGKANGFEIQGQV